MLRWVRHHDLAGCEVLDADGEMVGTVLDTLPADGGGEVEMLVLNVGRRFARRRIVPAGGIRVADSVVHVPFRRVDIEDAPCADDGRWGDPADVARGYWMFATD